jgi:CIC family chloride channel protein
MSLREILKLLPESRQNYFPVLDGNDRLVGIFSTDDIRTYLYDESIWQLAVARDIMTTQLVIVAQDDDLNTAMRRFTELNLDEIPVLESAAGRKLLGMLRRKDAIAVYNRRLMEQKQAVLEHG